MPDTPTAPQDGPGAVQPDGLGTRRVVAGSWARNAEQVGVKCQAAVELGFDVEVVRREVKSGGWYVFLYRRGVEA